MKINSYLIGDNSNNLLGTHNDAKLIYNLFNSFFKLKSKWEKPQLFLNNFIFNFIKKNKKKTMFIIYFSGHSTKDGNVLVNNKYFDCLFFLNLIDNLKLNNVNVLFIIDSCYSEQFIKKKKYKYIKKIEFLVSCQKNETSKEILVDFERNNYDNINYNYNKIVHGIFTFYLYKILKKNKKLINNIKCIVNNPIFSNISKKFNQKIIYQCI
jgi:hypothetical protein